MSVFDQELSRSDFDRCRWQEAIATAPKKDCQEYSSLFLGNPVESERLSLRRVSGDGEESRRGSLRLLPCGEPRSAPAPPGRGRLLRPAGGLSVPRRRPPPR
jgi:hypothetical protein